MSIKGLKQNCCVTTEPCPDLFGCPPGLCPDFEIKQHDTQPPFRLSVADCNGPLDLTDTVAEVSMWALGKIRKPLTPADTYFSLADNVGFFQANVGDVIVLDRVRNPEQMIITGFDENLNFVQVQRGYNGTAPGTYKRGQKIRIFRILNAVATTETLKDNSPQDPGFGIGEKDSIDQRRNGNGPWLDGHHRRHPDEQNDHGGPPHGLRPYRIDREVVDPDEVVTDSQLIYNWTANDTCMPGCYYLEFKLLKMLQPSSLSLTPDIADVWTLPKDVDAAKLFNNASIRISSTYPDTPSVIPSFISTVSDCDIGSGVEWVRRFPSGQSEGFLIRINPSPTNEKVL